MPVFITSSLKHILSGRPIVSCPTFLFSCYGHYCDLDSFPTRRSSDLECGGRGGRKNETMISPLPSEVLPGPTGICSTGDRKSTRLNSSHGYTAYAVFCVKTRTNT